MAGQNYDISLYWAGWHLMNRGIQGVAGSSASFQNPFAIAVARELAALVNRVIPLLETDKPETDLLSEQRHGGEVILGATLAFAALALPPILGSKGIGSPTDWETDANALMKEIQMFICAHAPETLKAAAAQPPE